MAHPPLGRGDGNGSKTLAKKFLPVLIILSRLKYSLLKDDPGRLTHTARCNGGPRTKTHICRTGFAEERKIA